MQTPPPNTQVAPLNTTQTSASSDTARLSDEASNPSVKNVLLQIYLAKVIRQNEQAGVNTGVSVVDMQTNQVIENYNIDTEQFAASINKLPIARLVLEDLQSGALKADQVLTWTPDDVRAGAGVYDQPGAPTQATVQALLFDMLNPSGNTAVRVFVNHSLGGAAQVNSRFQQELGLSHTYLQPLTGNTFYLGNTTARESLANLQNLLSGSNTYTAFIKNALVTNIYTDYGVRSQLAGNSYITLANKVGILDDPTGNNRHDVGIIYNTFTQRSYAYAFLNTAPGPAYNTATSQAGISLADMGRGLLRYSGDKANHGEKALNDARPFTDVRVRF